MLFIDWISTPDHKNFNRSFFSALAQKNAKLIVFSEKLIISEVECNLQRQEKSRLMQAIKILKIVWHHRDLDVFLLTYDPLFVPIISLFVKQLVVFEHNTTPEKGSVKHCIWQRCFFGKIHRMAQFPTQYERLVSLGAKVTYIGSPILPVSNREIEKKKASLPFLFIAPSYRLEISELNAFSEYFNGCKILIKKILKTDCVYTTCDYIIEQLARLEFIHNDQRVNAVIITVQSPLRGSGWFNDAISNCVPVIVTNQNARILFESTFPGHPFIDMMRLTNLSEFEHLVVKLGEFDSHTYAQLHNTKLQNRFIRMCAELGVQSNT